MEISFLKNERTPFGVYTQIRQARTIQIIEQKTTRASSLPSAMLLFTLQSVFVFNGILTLITASLIYGFFPGRIDSSGRLWMLGCLLAGSAILLTGFRSDLPSIFMMKSSADIEITLKGFRTELPEYLTYGVANGLQWLAYLFSVMSLRCLLQGSLSLRWISVSIVTACLTILIFEWLRLAQLNILAMLLKNGLYAMTLVYLIELTDRVKKASIGIRYLTALSRCWYILAALSVFHALSTLLNESVHWMDPVTLDWLCFTLMLITGLLTQFIYLGMRLSQAEIHRMKLAISNQQLTQTVQERSDLLQSIVDTLALEQLESFAARIAHHINQPLTAIQMVLEALISTPMPPTEQKEQLIFVLEDVGRVAKVVSETREMMRLTHYETQVLEANSLLLEFVQIMNNDTHSTRLPAFHVSFIPTHAPTWVQVNKAALFQVLLTFLSPTFLKTGNFIKTAEQEKHLPSVVLSLSSEQVATHHIALRIQLPLKLSPQALHFFNTCDVEFQPPIHNDKQWMHKLIWIWHSLRKLDASLKATDMVTPVSGTQIDFVLKSIQIK